MAEPFPKSEVSAAYDEWAETYDSVSNRTRDLDAAVVQGLRDVVAGRDILELGCGTGKNTAWLAEVAATVTAVDFSPGMLAEARARISSPAVRFELADITGPWPADAESADVVLINLVLEHLDDLGWIFAEGARVIRRDGHLFLCELHPLRQAMGSQAQFARPDGTVQRVQAITHTIPEFLDAAIMAGLELVRSDEWSDDEDRRAASPPRLFSALFRKP